MHIDKPFYNPIDLSSHSWLGSLLYFHYPINLSLTIWLIVRLARHYSLAHSQVIVAGTGSYPFLSLALLPYYWLTVHSKMYALLAPTLDGSKWIYEGLSLESWIPRTFHILLAADAAHRRKNISYLRGGSTQAFVICP